MLLLVGLGNPTPDSENNRHNIGFKIIDAINKNLDFQNKSQSLKDFSQLEMLGTKKFMQ